MSPVIPRATVARLPRYLRFLEEVAPQRSTTSSDEIAEGTGVTAAQVRKDLSHLGTLGTRGVGYDTVALRDLIARALGLGEDLKVALVGAGNLGTALANYGGFGERGFEIVAIYDRDPDRIGSTVGRLEVRDVDRLRDDAISEEFAIGIIATPAGAAQDVTDTLVQSGVHTILNFAPRMVRVPEGTVVRQVDLAIEMQILAYYRDRAH